MAKAKIPDKALHYSDGKLGIGQIPEEVLMMVGLAYSYGEQKYGRDNWKTGTDYHEFYESARRHMAYFWVGEHWDLESGLPHLAHAIWNLMTLLYYGEYDLGNDDRPKNETLLEMIREDLESIPQRIEASKLID